MLGSGTAASQSSILDKGIIKRIDVFSDDVPCFFSEGTFSEILADSGSLMTPLPQAVTVACTGPQQHNGASSVFICCIVPEIYRTLAKVRPWALHLTFSPNRGVGALSSVSAFNLERAPTFVYVHK